LKIILLKLRQQLTALDISNNFKCCLEGSKRLKMTFAIDAGAKSFQLLRIDFKGAIDDEAKRHSNSDLFQKSIVLRTNAMENNGATAYAAFNPDKKHPDFNYESLNNAYDRIYTYIIGTPIGAFPKAADYLTTIEYHNGTTWAPLTDLIVW
jgi:hypothetical protein